MTTLCIELSTLDWDMALELTTLFFWNSILERERQREMACNTLSLISSPAETGIRNIKRGLHQSKSTKKLGREATIRRCFSENHICCSKSSISVSSELKSSEPIGALPFQVSSSILPSAVQSFDFDSDTSNNMSLVEERYMDIDSNDEVGTQEEKIKRLNWIERLLEIRSHWQPGKRTKGDDELEKDESGGCGDDDAGGDEVSYSSDEDEEKQERKVNHDRETFSKLLVQVSPQETRLFSQLAFLCDIAYVIPTIKPQELRDIFGLKLVTSSIDKKAEAAAIKDKFELDSTHIPIAVSAESTDSHQPRVMNVSKTRSLSLGDYIAVAAATYVHQHYKDLQSFDLESQEEGYGDGEQIQEEERNPHRTYGTSNAYAYDMATSTMTEVILAGEKEKQEAAQDLQSHHSSPCEWFICDDLKVRYFVIQESDSSASWQANLLFEPTEFEGTDAIVHRGIYVASKSLYEQFLPKIISHLEKNGADAKFQFTGHSLGGSLALLLTLMLLKRGILKPTSLQAVVTFGSPFIFCGGGHKILNQLGVDDNLVRSVIMHRDIVPRVFACSYPNQIDMLLKRLIRKKLLYSPVGKVFILQPDEKTSPSHPLLPPGNALYALDTNRFRHSSMAALRYFLNRPHLIATLSNPSAYGSDGTILRDHDSSNYLKALNGVLRQQMKVAGVGRRIVTPRKQENELWPLLTSPLLHSWRHRSNLPVNKEEVLTGV